MLVSRRAHLNQPLKRVSPPCGGGLLSGAHVQYAPGIIVFVFLGRRGLVFACERKLENLHIITPVLLFCTRSITL